jgi:hypothetical protein
MGARNGVEIGLSYRPARLNRLTLGGSSTYEDVSYDIFCSCSGIILTNKLAIFLRKEADIYFVSHCFMK